MNEGHSEDEAMLHMDIQHILLGLFSASLYTYRALGFFKKPPVL